MSLPVSPLKTITKLDRTQEKDLYYAADTQQYPLRYLHFSGTDLTENKAYAWYGTRRQFYRICELYEWDGLCLISPMKSREKG